MRLPSAILLLTVLSAPAAARAGTTTARPWGDGRDGACAHANVADTTVVGARRFEARPEHFGCAGGHAHTAPVGRSPANATGLRDMLGNVREWVANCWNPSYAGAPADADARHDGDCARRAVRGGGWFTNPALVRPANRFGVDIADRDSDMGFRVARVD
ncbi:MAG: SUMF1/EgtB/PvdO family nonheme iron enzyme [Rhodospirillales bacterium]|nr:MAG: SUMF1/EgtB/PvdO family nonheme iron enzyme [Rhodospirillales bacterium]